MAYNANTGADQHNFILMLANKFINAAHSLAGFSVSEVYEVGTIHDYNNGTKRPQPYLIVEYPTSRIPNIRKPLEYYDLRLYMFCIDDPTSGSGNNTYFNSTKDTSGTKIYSRMQDWFMTVYDRMAQTSQGTSSYPYFDGEVRFTPRGKVGQDAAWCLQMDCTIRVYRGHADVHTADTGEDDN